MNGYILGFDTETTGVSPENGDRIIEIALIKYDWNGNKLSEYVKRFDPECAIDPKAQAVHGIAYAELVGEPKFQDHAQEIADLIDGADLLIAHNMQFDSGMITAEFVRSSVRVPQTASFCTMINSRWSCFDGKQPKLKEVCFALGVDYDDSLAHAATYDVEVMMTCFFKAMNRDLYVTALENALTGEAA